MDVQLCICIWHGIHVKKTIENVFLHMLPRWGKRRLGLWACNKYVAL